MIAIPRVRSARVCGPSSVLLTFSDGTRKRVNLRALLKGPVFKPLRDPEYFRSLRVDPMAGTITWRNGADIAPETLYDLPAEDPSPKPKTGNRRMQRPVRASSKRDDNFGVNRRRRRSVSRGSRPRASRRR
jgi:hypothetical protein